MPIPFLASNSLSIPITEAGGALLALSILEIFKLSSVQLIKKMKNKK
jgi:hypothetical protein